ncbi:hypothetical protein B9Z19DRAFT_1133000 [Tuber borchii]|uniref:Uncharacterized protein n=1 Tax=Tuber borchii TaxID=42251 RepID=A0A2T6ZGI7_TUBBO|nr:hypothetical protein B9Z19DRAFT_1133000 [Tuber borchii]
MVADLHFTEARDDIAGAAGPRLGGCMLEVFLDVQRLTFRNIIAKVPKAVVRIGA